MRACHRLYREGLRPVVVYEVCVVMYCRDALVMRSRPVRLYIIQGTYLVVYMMVYCRKTQDPEYIVRLSVVPSSLLCRPSRPPHIVSILPFLSLLKTPSPVPLVSLLLLFLDSPF